MTSKNSEKPKVLIVDDEKSICESLAGFLSDEGWQPLLAYSGKEGLRRFTKDTPDLVLLDVWMEGMDGIDTLQKMREWRQDVPIVIMSGHGTIETAVKATKLGAFDYLEKPLSIEKLFPMLDHALMIKRQQIGKEKIWENKGIPPLIGTSDAIREIREKIAVVAEKSAWVLITGENGTGKEVVVQHIHAMSPRAKYNLVAVNCAAIPEELIESELFGHEKGAFTHAVTQKKGKFEVADKGTLFLDEIGDMSSRTQAKVLRVLQEQSFERIGGHKTIRVDVRVVAATNKDLRQEIENGRFREDLYYRLNVVPFHMPPLRERREDILLLADYFIEKNCADLGEVKKNLSEEVKDVFVHYSWPGNVRELKNLIERLCIMNRGQTIELDELPMSIIEAASEGTAAKYGKKSEAQTLREARWAFERQFILDKLEEYDWNVSKTAEAIGIERSNLHRKLRSFDIDPKTLKG